MTLVSAEAERGLIFFRNAVKIKNAFKEHTAVREIGAPLWWYIGWLTFDLAFRWAKVRSKYRLKLKSSDFAEWKT